MLLDIGRTSAESGAMSGSAGIGFLLLGLAFAISGFWMRRPHNIERASNAYADFWRRKGEQRRNDLISSARSWHRLIVWLMIVIGVIVAGQGLNAILKGL